MSRIQVNRKYSLSEVCEINPSSRNGLQDDDMVTFIPMASVDEIDGLIKTRLERSYGQVKKGFTRFSEGDILFAKITPCMENGKCAIVKGTTNGVGFGSTEFHVIRPKSEVRAEWIFFFLRQNSVRELAEKSMTGSAGQKRVPKSFLSRLEIPVPDIKVQDNICKRFLNLQLALQKRRQANALTEQFLQSTFLEMFGDPVSNENGWEVKKIDDVFEVQTGSTPSRKKPEYFNGSIPWVKTGEVHWDTILDTEEKISEIALNNSNCKIFPTGTILIAMYGQGITRGKAAILGLPASTNQACAAILPTDQFDMSFLLWLLKISYNDIRDLGRGGNQPNLNLNLVRTYSVIVPPLDLQQKFSMLLKSIDRLRQKQRESERYLQELFNSLMQKYFG